MKTIIVATDYSASSIQTIEFAAQLALQTKASLLLHHAFFVPYAVTEAPVQLPSSEELQEEHNIKLEIIGQRIREQYDIKVAYDARPKPLFEGLGSLFLQKKADLVIMGIHTARNWERILFGSNAADTIRKAFFPVLVVPEYMPFHPFRRIVFACDFASLTLSAELSLLKELAVTFEAQVRILHVGEYSSQEDEYANKNGRINLEILLREIDHSYAQVDSDTIAEGIEKGTKQFEADLLVMAPHSHTIWDAMLNRSNTRKMALQTNIPLLTLSLSV
jgi:nucleotide-binding universal stress UspA family protein